MGKWDTLPFVAVAAVALPAMGQDPAPHEVVMNEGQPFCTDIADLPQMVSAVMQNDQAAIASVKGCVRASAGTRVSVLQVIASGSAQMHVVLVRFKRPDGTTAEGYTVELGLPRR